MNYASRHRASVRAHQLAFFDRRVVRIAVCALTLTVAVAYFFQVTSAAGRGYELKRASDRESVLMEETRRLELNIAETSSAGELQNRAQALGLKPITSVHYASAPDLHSVAIK